MGNSNRFVFVASAILSLFGLLMLLGLLVLMGLVA